MNADNRWPVSLMPDGSFRSFAEWGCYPIMHVTADNGVLCGKCANENKELCTDPDNKQWHIVASDTAEGTDHTCEHCNEPFDKDAYDASIVDQNKP